MLRSRRKHHESGRVDAATRTGGVLGVSDFQGRSVLVTGAAGGIGQAIARAFAAAGAAVVGIDRIAGSVCGIAVIGADLLNEQEVIGAVAAGAAQLGTIDVLVNCAGTDGENPLAGFDVKDFDRIFGVNVRGTILVSREALKHMKAGARIINIASELAFIGRSGQACYSASKGAILTLTRSWARELGPGIQVNAIAPGPIDAPMLRWESITEEVRKEEVRNPAGRIGRPDEVANAVLFLAHPRTTYITGQCLNVDGGVAMH
jgi:3-oxoacyl-[acyl-carrier protein] reductase